ncbi:hypothetical protein IBX35_01700 [Candidatus Bathyarchaeota archaeon]|nr:hypothetical protein [Candidatus Bathyarchaeota archaeon]
MPLFAKRYPILFIIPKKSVFRFVSPLRNPYLNIAKLQSLEDAKQEKHNEVKSMVEEEEWEWEEEEEEEEEKKEEW